MIPLAGVPILPAFHRLTSCGSSNWRAANHLFQQLDYHPTEAGDYIAAAGFFNLCRSKGVQGSNTDFLICAVAVRAKVSIFTLDKDFDLFSKHLPIVLHK